MQTWWQCARCLTHTNLAPNRHECRNLKAEFDAADRRQRWRTTPGPQTPWEASAERQRASAERQRSRPEQAAPKAPPRQQRPLTPQERDMLETLKREGVRKLNQVANGFISKLLSAMEENSDDEEEELDELNSDEPEDEDEDEDDLEEIEEEEEELEALNREEEYA